MDLNTKLIKKHFLAYWDNHISEQAFRIRAPVCNGINKINLSQMGECVNPLLPV